MSRARSRYGRRSTRVRGRGRYGRRPRTGRRYPRRSSVNAGAVILVVAVVIVIILLHQ
jgi:hypothetical protein